MINNQKTQIKQFVISSLSSFHRISPSSSYILITQLIQHEDSNPAPRPACVQPSSLPSPMPASLRLCVLYSLDAAHDLEQSGQPGKHQQQHHPEEQLGSS